MVIADRYRLLARIGSGASGSVYRAHDQLLDREVALKLLRPGEPEEAEHEAQLLARVAHRNVVSIHDFGQSAGRRYLVLEYLAGQDFRGWLSERPSNVEIVRNFTEAACGLAAAHRAGLVHGDFKPSNVILTDAGRVVVIDFGCARVLGRGRGRGRAGHGGDGYGDLAEGTLAYMAPECLAGHANDARSDQFALCVALWEALAGSNPFAGSDPLARYRSIHDGLGHDGLGRAVLTGVPASLRAALERGLSFEPARRFATIDDLVAELERPWVTARRRIRRPLITALAVVTTYMLGWGLVPETGLVDEAQSKADPEVVAAMAVLGLASEHARDGDGDATWAHAKAARQLLLNSREVGDPDYCSFGESLVPIGDALLAGGRYERARLVYAMALRHLEDCGLPLEAVDDRKMQARNLSLREAGIEGRALAVDPSEHQRRQ